MVIAVVGAIIRQGDRILIAQRPEGKNEALLWEFPGGKVEEGETPESCLAREIAEELAVEIRVGEIFADNVHSYGERMIHLTCYWAELISGEPRPVECAAVAWITGAELGRYEFAPADVPIVDRLRRVLSS